MPGEAALLMEDETILRLFPVLRRAWALRGQQAVVPITGRNAKRVLFGACAPAVASACADPPCGRLTFKTYCAWHAIATEADPSGCS